MQSKICMYLCIKNGKKIQKYTFKNFTKKIHD